MRELRELHENNNMYVALLVHFLLSDFIIHSSGIIDDLVKQKGGGGRRNTRIALLLERL